MGDQLIRDEPKRVHIRTYGCQMNVYDSERMRDALTDSGYVDTDRAEDADLVILNTCHIREKATEKVYSELGRFKARKRENPNLRIAVAGCVAQAEGEEVMRRQPLVDFVVGPQSYHRLAEMVRTDSRETNTDFPRASKFDSLPERSTIQRRASAFLTVQEGCDKFCSFCVVPYTRGAESSRPVESILQEAERLVEQGVREIVLLGQNVNAYHGIGADNRQWSLAEIINRLARIEGLCRIRFTTSHPLDMTDDLIAAFAECDKLMPYLHLPVQTGSDKVLKAMNRRHCAADYLDIIGKIRAARPDILLSGDFIVGFPGESESDFEQTLSIVRQVRYGHAYSFRYSPRPGTPAADRPQVDSAAAADRLGRLQTLLRSQQEMALQSMVGRRLPILFERRGRKRGQLAGKSEYQHAVHCQADDDMLGEVTEVYISSAEANSLSGEIVVA
ncbi:MAG: tRNA (N6-isopentenyl adenosine(37)-C2)-methylthiotransferase MiaB [Rhodobacteraceae bacterium]|nr:tRNA (N6-isopentenyl adenosine(37)-C2)-methylthiotransferase MiaB [Paracoccaceae bacterium]